MDNKNEAVEYIPEKEYLFSIVIPLTATKDIRVDRTVDDKGVLLSLHLRKEDMGRVIGKQGETARSIRRLLRQFGLSNNMHVALKINEPTYES